MSGNYVYPAGYYHQNNHQRFAYNDEKENPNDDDDEDDDNTVSRYEGLKDAILHRDRGSIVWLMKEGCPLNIPVLDKASESPLHVAVFVNDLVTARALLSAKADLNSFNLLKQTPLHMAFEMRNRDMVDILLSYCDGVVNPFTVYGLSHFHISCVRNNWRVAHAFLERGVNANVYLEKCFYGKDYVFYRPLHLAVKYENFEVAELLLKYGANVNAKDRYKRTPLHLACRYNYKRLCETAKRKFSGNDKVPVAAGDLMRLLKRNNDQVDIVKLLIRYGGDVDALDANNTPPLFHTFKCDLNGIKSIVRGDDDDDEYDDDDDENSLWRELSKEIKLVQKEKFYILVENGADVRFSNESRETLVHLVIDGKRLFTNYLGSIVISRDHSGRDDISDEDKSEIVDSLLQYGADADAKNSNGQTALQMAISSYYVRITATLLEYYAAVDNVCFFHYKIPKNIANNGSSDGLIGCVNCRDDNDYAAEMENMLDIIGMVLERKRELELNCSNELLMLRYLACRDRKMRHLENCGIGDLRRLLDYGDINRMNLSFLASENSMLFDREKVNIVLEHVLKLEIAGFSVAGRIRRNFLVGYTSAVATRHRHQHGISYGERCRDEINKLKNTWIDRYASFYDLMFISDNEIAVRMKNEKFRRTIKRVLKPGTFELYGNIIVRQFLNGLLRSILFDSAKGYLLHVIERDLPDPCAETILGHLRNEDLCNLSLAFVK